MSDFVTKPAGFGFLRRHQSWKGADVPIGWIGHMDHRVMNDMSLMIKQMFRSTTFLFVERIMKRSRHLMILRMRVELAGPELQIDPVMGRWFGHVMSHLSGVWGSRHVSGYSRSFINCHLDRFIYHLLRYRYRCRRKSRNRHKFCFGLPRLIVRPSV